MKNFSQIPVSVIIPVYNRRKFVIRAIESVLNQRYKNFELIVVDDGSTDKIYKKIAADYPQIKCIRTENRGVSAARNTGIKTAACPYVAFLDSDDEWKKDKLVKQMSFMVNHPKLLISHTDEEWIRNKKRVNKPEKYKKYGGNVYAHCLPLTMIGPSTVIIKKELFDYAGYFDESMIACEDYDLWLRITCRFRVGYLDEPLTVKYGGHKDQLSNIVDNLDAYRVMSLVKMLNSGLLIKKYVQSTKLELRKKINIIISGLKKKKKEKEISLYENILKDFGIR